MDVKGLTLAVKPAKCTRISDADQRAYKTEVECEYRELCHRIEELEHDIVRAERGTLWYGEPACPVKVLKRQARAMRAYRDEFELRMAYEGMELNRV